VPLPWSGAAAPFGFSPADAASEPWLPQPASWATLTVEAQAADPASMLSLYRAMLALRRTEPGLRDDALRWLRGPADVLMFARGERFVCCANLSAEPVPLPADASLLLASAPLADGRLPVDATAWLRAPRPPAATEGGRG
jgi:alpha-glucosidase